MIKNILHWFTAKKILLCIATLCVQAFIAVSIYFHLMFAWNIGTIITFIVVFYAFNKYVIFDFCKKLFNGDFKK